mmetsp:Transcript_4909/g.10403  ORF Transcript_4909/g.10403 Transcript_4909/m.10403 type:complete len:302 (-) Transcript_4909:1556-2461(-)
MQLLPHSAHNVGRAGVSRFSSYLPYTRHGSHMMIFSALSETATQSEAQPLLSSPLYTSLCCTRISVRTVSSSHDSARSVRVLTCLNGQVDIVGCEVEAGGSRRDHGERVLLAQCIPEADASVQGRHASLSRADEGLDPLRLRLAVVLRFHDFVRLQHLEKLSTAGLLLNLAHHGEHLDLIVTLLLREPVHPVGCLLDDLLEDARSRRIVASIGCYLERMDLHTAHPVEIVVALVGLCGEVIEAIHEFLERHLGDQLDELGACVVANIAGGVAGHLDHLLHVDDGPEERALEHQLDCGQGQR